MFKCACVCVCVCVFVYIWVKNLPARMYVCAYVYINIRDVIVIVVGNGHGDTSSNPGRDCISHSTNTLGKGMTPIILPPAMRK